MHQGCPREKDMRPELYDVNFFLAFIVVGIVVKRNKMLSQMHSVIPDSFDERL
jgi:hypothetical protein